jgi:hypothetical protein
VKLLQERIIKTLQHKVIGNTSLNRTPIAQKLRERIDKWECFKLKKLLPTKETVTTLKKQPTKQEKIFAG